jgi:hypothetical protein
MISIFQSLGLQSSPAAPAAASGKAEAPPDQAGPRNALMEPTDDLALRSLTLLVQCLQLNLIRAKALNHTAVDQTTNQLLSRLDVPAATPGREQAALDATGAACQSFQQYFRGLGESIDAVGIDLATSIRALATILHEQSGQQGQFLDQMEKVRHQFQNGHSLDDIRSLRVHLDNCLSTFRAEIFTARQEQRKSRDQVSAELARLNRNVSTLRSALPAKSGEGPAVAILRVRRLQAIRDRYGDEIAQRIVDYLTQILLVRWPAARDITPWAFECLVVVDTHNVDLDFHRAALRKLAGERIMFSSQHDGHDISLPVAIDWTVVRAPADNDLEQFIATFLESTTQKDTQAASLDRALGIRA